MLSLAKRLLNNFKISVMADRCWVERAASKVWGCGSNAHPPLPLVRRIRASDALMGGPPKITSFRPIHGSSTKGLGLADPWASELHTHSEKHQHHAKRQVRACRNLLSRGRTRLIPGLFVSSWPFLHTCVVFWWFSLRALGATSA